MTVRIRMKKFGRKHRPFFRICAVDKRSPRDGRVIEELGTYDPMVSDVDARAILNPERIEYWLSVGALPSERVSVLIKKYGKDGTHVEKQKAALDRLAESRRPREPISPPSQPAAKSRAAEAEAQGEEETASENNLDEPADE